jgi:hypothetical protein
VIAIAICVLMLFFAVGSKVAAYHSKELAARSMAATKVWQAKHVAADSEALGPSVTLQAAMELLFFLSLSLVPADLPLWRELCPAGDAASTCLLRPAPLGFPHEIRGERRVIGSESSKASSIDV